MRKQQILPFNRIQLNRIQLFCSPHLSDILTRIQLGFSWSNWLGWKQWLVLFSMGIAVIMIEVRNHSIMWQQHKSGQTILTDHELISEIILFGLIFPILSGIALGYMGRTKIERDDIARELDLRRTLVAHIHEAQSWPKLAELVVTMPGSVVAADRAWLLAQRSDKEKFDQIAHWECPESFLLPSYLLIIPAVCERCSLRTALKGTRILTCHRPNPESSLISYTRYCLWLSSQGSGKTALLFDMPFDRPLSMRQIKVLDDLGDEMSLAIENANLHFVNQRHGDIAMNERKRIARDLHDTLGQNISYLRFKLEQLNANQLFSGRIEFEDDMANMLMVADEAYEHIRDILEELRTTEYRDMEETVRLYAAQAAKRTGFSVQVHASGQPGTLSTRKSRQIMYILREALNNVEKHSGTQKVDIHLQWSAGEFKLKVCDGGKGFDPQEINKEDRYGMAIMRERSLAINANLDIKSTPGEGTELTLSLPLPSNVVVISRSQ